MKNSVFALLALGVVVPVTHANESNINGDVDLGYVASSGNSESESLSFASKLKWATGELSNVLELEAFSGSQDNKTSAEKYFLAYQLNKALNEQHSAFFRVDYNDDRFSGYDYQLTSSAGWSAKWTMPETHKLVSELGLGYRFSEFDTGTSDEEAILRLAANYGYQVSETTDFEQSLSADIGEDSTISKASSSIRVAISDALALKVALNFKHYSDPVPGTEDLDRETTVSLAYKF